MQVNEVITLLEMEPYADAVVGVPGEGLNVEQRKRLTIGVELAAKPELLLFLDEPVSLAAVGCCDCFADPGPTSQTSGLDSQTSWAICDLMAKLTEHGQVRRAPLDLLCPALADALPSTRRPSFAQFINRALCSSSASIGCSSSPRVEGEREDGEGFGPAPALR